MDMLSGDQLESVIRSHCELNRFIVLYISCEICSSVCVCVRRAVSWPS